MTHIEAKSLGKWLRYQLRQVNLEVHIYMMIVSGCKSAIFSLILNVRPCWTPQIRIYSNELMNE